MSMTNDELTAIIKRGNDATKMSWESIMKSFTAAPELAAEVIRLREALENIIFECGLHGMGDISGLTITTMAQNALKGARNE